MRRWMVAVVVVWMAAGMVCGQELDQRVPGEGTVVYVQWKGAGALRGQYDDSRLKKVVDESNLPLVFSEFLPRVVAKIKEQAPQDAQVLGDWLGALEVLGRYPTAIWWGGFVESAGRPPLPRLAIVCDAVDDAAAVQDKLIRALGENAKKWTIGIGTNRLWITPAAYADPFRREMEQAMQGRSLAQQADYQQARAQVMKQAALLVYVDGEQLADVVQQQKSATQAIEALGLNGLKHGLFAAGFEGVDWSCSAFIDAPAPRKGLMSLLDSEPLSDELLNRVPSSALGMTTARLSLSKLLDTIRTTLGKLDPQAQQQFNKMLGFATLTLGVNVETDLLAAFGNDWLVYDDPESTGGGIIGTVLVNRLADAEKAQRSLDAVARFMNSFLAGQLRNSAATVAVRQVKSGEVTISYLALPVISPAWGIKDGFLYASLYPQVTAQAMQFRAGDGKSIRDNEAFIAMQKRLGVTQGVMAVGFHDLPRQAPRAYPLVMMLSRLWSGTADLLSLKAPEMVLPPLVKIVPQLTPSGSVSWVDESGWHYRSISPFPCSGVFGGEWGAVLSQYPALTVALLPMLSQARESAQQAECMAQMRQLSLAILMYVKEHNGQTPETLGELLPYAGPAGAHLMCCPSAHVDFSMLPLSAPEQTKWIDEHTSYEYMVPKMKHSTLKPFSERIMIREKSALHFGKMNVAFADGHVQLMLPYQVENLIDAARAEGEDR